MDKRLIFWRINNLFPINYIFIQIKIYNYVLKHYIYIGINIYLCIYIHACVCMHICSYIHITCMCMHAHIYIYICMCIYDDSQNLKSRMWKPGKHQEEMPPELNRGNTMHVCKLFVLESTIAKSPTSVLF